MKFILDKLVYLIHKNMFYILCEVADKGDKIKVTFNNRKTDLAKVCFK
jgi:hypothetical protein